MSNAHFLKSGQKRWRKRRLRRNGTSRGGIIRLLQKTSGIAFVLLLAGLYWLDQSGGLPSLRNFSSGIVTKPSLAENLVGKAVVVDGDTIRINGQKVRLHGIDAPESSQLCTSDTGARIRCGAESTRYLKRFLRNSAKVTCSFIDGDRYGRFVGDCYRSDGKSLSAAMVRAGHALDWPKYSRRAYSSQQNRARAEKRGLWASQFEKPWEYRFKKRAG